MWNKNSKLNTSITCTVFVSVLNMIFLITFFNSKDLTDFYDVYNRHWRNKAEL